MRVILGQLLKKFENAIGMSTPRHFYVREVFEHFSCEFVNVTGHDCHATELEEPKVVATRSKTY